jgi:hypothetical protein
MTAAALVITPPVRATPSGNEKHLVIHAEPEDQTEDNDRYGWEERVDRRRQPDERDEMPVLKDQDSRTKRRTD